MTPYKRASEAAKLCEQTESFVTMRNIIYDAILAAEAAARVEQREADAILVERFGVFHPGIGIRRQIAAAIRRQETTP